MPLDPNIILQAKPIQLDNPLDVAQKAMTMKSLALQNQNMQREQDNQQDLRNAYTQAVTVAPDGTRSIDRQKLLNSIQNPMTAVSEGQKLSAQDAATNDQKLKVMNDHIQARKTLINTVPTSDQAPPQVQQAAWTDMINQLHTAGLPTDMYPAQYPGDQSRNMMASTLMSAEEKLAQQNKQVDQQTAKRKNDIEAYSAGMPGSSGPSPKGAIAPDTDPATLINRMVNPKQREKVGEEIKNTQDIVALKPQILDAFDRGSSRNPVIAAQGQKEFEGLINTTVKEQEGTARQAAFDSIHQNMSPQGLTALPGADAARRRTVLEYLASKASAPMSKANGIDLSKFKSTNFHTGTVNMKDPSGNIRAVPEDQVDAAKAAGGTPI